MIMNIHSWNLPLKVERILLKLSYQKKKKIFYKIKEGIVYLQPIFDLNEVKIGNKIVYKGEIGIVASKYNSILKTRNPKIVVYFPKLNRTEHLEISKCTIFVLYDEDLNKIIKLSFHDYEYIEKDIQKIEYYVGKHNYGILSDDFKIDNQWVKLYRTISNSKTFIKNLKKHNFKIIKK